MNENILNESEIKEDLSKCLNESDNVAKIAIDYLKSLGFEVSGDENFIEFKGETKNSDGEIVVSEGSIEFFDDGMSYSVVMDVDGKEMDADIGTMTQLDKDNIIDAVKSIVAPTFTNLN